MGDGKEYLMLRDEIIHLDELVNNTINFSYVFVAAILSFALTKSDSTFVLMVYVAVLPTYIIVLSKSLQIYRITAYLYVFCEGEDSNFKWEHRRHQYIRDNNGMALNNEPRSFHWPFLIADIATFMLFLQRNTWDVHGIIKFIIALICLMAIIILFLKYKNYETQNYIEAWEKVLEFEINGCCTQATPLTDK